MKVNSEISLNPNKDCMVTVIYTTYNHENYVGIALESFISQLTNFKYEIIVHDDASTDKTPEIIRRYELEHPELFTVIYQKENQWKKKEKHMWTDITFPKAQGKYIAICDGDDYWLDSYKLQKQFDFMEKNPEYMFCFHNAIREFENSRSKPSLFNQLDESKIHDFKSLVQRDWYIATSTLFFRNIIQNYPSWYSKVGGNNDYALELILSAHGPFYFMHDLMSIYRILPNSISSEFGKNRVFLFKSLIYVLNNVKELFPIEDQHIFQDRIEQLEKEQNRIQLNIDYPILQILNITTYKRLLRRFFHVK